MSTRCVQKPQLQLLYHPKKSGDNSVERPPTHLWPPSSALPRQPAAVGSGPPGNGSGANMVRVCDSQDLSYAQKYLPRGQNQIYSASLPAAGKKMPHHRQMASAGARRPMRGT